MLATDSAAAAAAAADAAGLRHALRSVVRALRTIPARVIRRFVIAAR